MCLPTRKASSRKRFQAVVAPSCGISVRDRVAESIYPLYREWLPQSGEALRDCPLFFDYVNLSPEVPENALITDIYLPLK
jgi:DNA gyrase inhibitor GyrI